MWGDRSKINFDGSIFHNWTGSLNMALIVPDVGVEFFLQQIYDCQKTSPRHTWHHSSTEFFLSVCYVLVKFCFIALVTSIVSRQPLKLGPCALPQLPLQGHPLSFTLSFYLLLEKYIFHMLLLCIWSKIDASKCDYCFILTRNQIWSLSSSEAEPELEASKNGDRATVWILGTGPAPWKRKRKERSLKSAG